MRMTLVRRSIHRWTELSMASLAVVVLLLPTGCGKVPTYQEMTQSKPLDTRPPEALPAAPAAVAVQTTPAPAAAPVVTPPDPAEVLAWFAALPPAQVNDQSLGRLASISSGLESVAEINARGGGLTDGGLEEVKKLPALKGLVLDATQVTDAGMASLLPVSTLESLSLSGTRVSAAGLSQLAALPKLTRLEMSSCDLTLEDCAAIGKLPVLEVLVLDHAPEVADALLEQICEASSLKSLNLDNCVGITDRGLLALAKIKGLEELKINKASITGAGFAAVLAKGGLKHLRALEVSGSPINQVGAKAINSMKTLETLNISSIPGMNDLFFGEFVEGLKNLKHLSVAMSPGLLGQGFVKLKSAVNSLETIDAHNSGVHDPIFEALKGHKKLKALNLDHSQVSLPGIQQFKKWTPGCEIQFGGQKY